MCNTTFCLHIHRSTIVMFVKSTLKILIGIKLLSLSVLCFHMSLIFAAFCFKLCNYYNRMLWKLESFDLTMLDSFFLISLPHHCSNVSHSPFFRLFCQSLLALISCYLCTPCQSSCCVHLFLLSFLNARQVWGWCFVLQYLHFCLGLFLYIWGLFLSPQLFFAFIIMSNSRLSLVVLSVAFYALCTPTLLHFLPTSIHGHLLFHLSSCLWLIL